MWSAGSSARSCRASADQPLDVGLHDQLQDGSPRQSRRKSPSDPASAEARFSVHVCSRSSGSRVVSVKSRNSTLDRTPRWPLQITLRIGALFHRRFRRKLHHVRGRYPRPKPGDPRPICPTKTNGNCRPLAWCMVITGTIPKGAITSTSSSSSRPTRDKYPKKR